MELPEGILAGSDYGNGTMRHSRNGASGVDGGADASNALVERR